MRIPLYTPAHRPIQPYFVIQPEPEPEHWRDTQSGVLPINHQNQNHHF